MRIFARQTLILTALVLAVQPVAAQHFCDGPPALNLLTGDQLTASGVNTEGHPERLGWYITPPGGSVPTKPITEVTTLIDLTIPGLWSIALEGEYLHQAIGGGLWTDSTCVTVNVSSVVAAIAAGSVQVPTDETLDINGFASVWAQGVVPDVEWQVDGQPLGACNGGPPPSGPGDLTCTIPADWLPPGWHTAGLLLTDPASDENSFATVDFEVIEVIPLSVDFDWTPFEPDPGQLVYFLASVTPATSEGDFVNVTWDLGDGEVLVYDSCPLFYGSCLEWPHYYATDGWYDVSITVETIDEIATRSYQIKVGDPVAPPTAAFDATPMSPSIMENVSFSFTGSCTGDCVWTWDFGDGGQSPLENTSHSWAVPDTYTVGLTVSNQSGSDFASLQVSAGSCWSPAVPVQAGSCHGGPVTLTADAGSAWVWSSGGTTRVISSPFAGSYWANVNDGAGCWGHSQATVVLDNCGDIGGDVNLDTVVDAGDLAALIPELTDGDGDTVVGAGGGDLTAPGGDVTGDYRLRVDDLLETLEQLFQ